MLKIRRPGLCVTGRLGERNYCILTEKQRPVFLN